MKHLNKYAITLALLLGAATGTWAQDNIQVTQVQGQANKWQYTMPDIDVELTVNYFPTAAFSEGGEPAALEGVDPGTDAAIVSTGQSQQGTVMYYATTDAEATAPDYDADCWTTVVPTAAIVQGNIFENDKVYVFYYIKGNDAPEGQAATAENNFNDTDILGPLTVTLNVNTVDLRPATQFTTDGGQATVTVDGQAIVTVDGQPTDNFMLKRGGGRPSPSPLPRATKSAPRRWTVPPYLLARSPAATSASCSVKTATSTPTKQRLRPQAPQPCPRWYMWAATPQ